MKAHSHSHGCDNVCQAYELIYMIGHENACSHLE